jgi:hypothetical protein
MEHATHQAISMPFLLADLSLEAGLVDGVRFIFCIRQQQHRSEPLPSSLKDACFFI